MPHIELAVLPGWLRLVAWHVIGLGSATGCVGRSFGLTSIVDSRKTTSSPSHCTAN